MASSVIAWGKAWVSETGNLCRMQTLPSEYNRLACMQVKHFRPPGWHVSKQAGVQVLEALVGLISIPTSLYVAAYMLADKDQHGFSHNAILVADSRSLALWACRQAWSGFVCSEHHSQQPQRDFVFNLVLRLFAE